jgi:hypothetical protein
LMTSNRIPLCKNKANAICTLFHIKQQEVKYNSGSDSACRFPFG